MSIFVVNYDYLDDVQRTARKLTSAYQKRQDDINGISRQLNSISTRRNNLSQANYFIRKKSEQYQEKINKLDRFTAKVTGFVEDVKSTDKAVATRIKTSSSNFRKLNNIRVCPIAAALVTLKNAYLSKLPFSGYVEAKIKEKYRNIKERLKDWYRDGGGKYIVKIISEIGAIAVLITLTVLSGGIAGVLAGIAFGLALFNSMSEIGYNIKAYNERGNKWKADKTSQKGGLDAASYLIGKGFYFGGMLAGKDKETLKRLEKIGQTVGTVAYTGLSLITLISSFRSLAKNAKEYYGMARKGKLVKNIVRNTKFVFNQAIGKNQSIKYYKFTNVIEYFKKFNLAYKNTNIKGLKTVLQPWKPFVKTYKTIDKGFDHYDDKINSDARYKIPEINKPNLVIDKSKYNPGNVITFPENKKPIRINPIKINPGNVVTIPENNMPIKFKPIVVNPGGSYKIPEIKIPKRAAPIYHVALSM